MVRPRVASLISKRANVVSCINVSDHVCGAFAPGHNGIRAHPGLISGQTSESQNSAKPEECDGQTVRPF